MFDPFKKLKLASAFLGVAEDAVRVDANLELGDLFGRLDIRSLGLDVARLLDQDGVRPLYDSKYLPQPEPLDRLHAYGDGTLGREVARYLRAQKQQRLLGPPSNFDYRDPAAYLALRVRMTHPIIHVLTEYDATPLGELAVQSYYVGQLGNLMSGVMISSALLQITRDMPDKLGDALAILAEAYQRGQTAKPFLGIAWEELWSAQVPQLRELADLVPRSSNTAMLDLDALAEPEPPPPPRVNLSGFSGGAAEVTPLRNAVAAPAESRVEPRGRPVSQSSLLASFMALAEQAQEQEKQSHAQPPRTPEPEPDEAEEPELVDPSPRHVAKPPPPPLRVQSQPLPQPQPPRPPSRPVTQPGFSVEESDPKIMPAMSPDDPDFF
ncbi:Coq4 family protein [Nannocystis bainbridge]|uniref:Coq4 family protein n=1 Tax=Nannocystis bainbridge TaxID=2995303 RepID=A0ABT5DTE1_9BACT|nr:Coq4 family protein [Nannocystis bainbridge]MDC0716909.1 Coq4 family protein [Nannocystis bainbridge]